MQLHFFSLLVCIVSLSVNAQRGVRVGYIDMDYILENVAEYNEAKSQLDAKVRKWKTEIDGLNSGIELLKSALESEKVLLTKELIEEREEDIYFKEKEVSEFQLKRFGPSGDLVIQKQRLIQPIQDQVFNAVQQIAKNKKYDFIFDKSADVVMLYSADRYDISDLVLRIITRSAKREQLKGKKAKQAFDEENGGSLDDADKDLQAKKAAARAKLAERERIIEEKRAEREKLRQQKIKEYEDRRNKLLEARKRKRDSILAVKKKNSK